MDDVLEESERRTSVRVEILKSVEGEYGYWGRESADRIEENAVAELMYQLTSILFYDSPQALSASPNPSVPIPRPAQTSCYPSQAAGNE